MLRAVQAAAAHRARSMMGRRDWLIAHTAVPGGPSVDGAAAILVVLRHVRRDVHRLQGRD